MTDDIKVFNNLLSCQGAKIGDLMERAQQLELNGYPRLAIALYNALIDVHPLYNKFHLAKAVLYRGLGDLKESTDALRRASEIAPDDDAATHILSLSYLGCRQEYAAISKMETYLARHPHVSHLRIHLVQALFNLRYFDLSVKHSRLVEDRPGTWWSGAIRKSRETLVDRRSAAIEILIRKRRGKALSQQDLFRLANLLSEVGRVTPALRLTVAMMRNEPFSFGAFQLHHFLITRKSGLEAGLSFLQSIDWLHGDRPEYRTIYVENLFQLERYSDVLRYCEVNVSDGPMHISEARAFSYYYTQRNELSSYLDKWAARNPDSTKVNSFRVMLSRSAFDWSLGGGGNPSSVPSSITIPRSLIQFWDSSDIPQEVQVAADTWKSGNAGFSYQIFSERDAIEFIDLEYGGEMVENFLFCHHPAMKSDFFRVAYLAAKGGIYVDADEVCLKPLEGIISREPGVEFIASVADEAPGYVHNWFLASSPKSEVLMLAIQDISETLRSNRLYNRRGDIWITTGPGLITRAVGRWISERKKTRTVAEVRLITEKLYRSFAIEKRMAYKGTISGNWRNA